MHDKETLLGLSFIGLLILYAVLHSPARYQVEHNLNQGKQQIEYVYDMDLQNRETLDQDYTIKSLVSKLLGGD